MRPTLTIFWYSLLSLFRYRVNWMWPVTAPLTLAGPAVLVGIWGEKLGGLDSFQALTGTPEYIQYMVLGALYWNFVEVIWWVFMSLESDMREGTLEVMWGTPVPRLGLLLGWSLAPMCFTVPFFAAGLGVIFGLGSIPPGLRLLEALLVVFLSVLGSCGFAFFFAGLALRFKDAESIGSIVGNLAPLLGGVFFPIFLLPEPLRALAWVFPFTYGMDLLRASWFNSPTVLPKEIGFAILLGLSVFYLWAGWRIFWYFEKKARSIGLESF